MTLWHIETSSRCRLSSIKSWSRESLLSSRGTGLDERSVSPGVKLAVTLRHLVTVDSYTTLQYAFRVACSLTIKKFVPEVCDAITRAYRDQVMRCTTLLEDWLWLSLSSAGGGTFHMPWVPWMEGIFQSDVHKGEQPLPQLQGLPLYCTLGPGGWRLQVPVGGRGGSRVSFRCSDFQAHRFEAQNRRWQHRLP